MQFINFDEHFQQFTSDWVRDHAEDFGNNYDRMEEQMPQVYSTWLSTPAEWLGGETPGTYFARFSDAGELVAWMRGYFAGAVPVPDQLLERITDLGHAAEEALLTLLADEAAPEEARLTAITLLSEMESASPMQRYIDWIAARAATDTRADMAAEALTAMGAAVVKPILLAVDAATASGRETFVDVLCNFPGVDDAIYALAIRLFREETEKRALYASLLGKLGDERAVDALREALDDAALSYLDYIELRNALEALGAEAPPERVFDGDPYYESLRRME